MESSSWVRVVVSAVGLLLAAGAMGCGSSVNSLCNEVCDCVGCSEVEEQDCVDEGEDAQKTAEDEGCSDQLDEVYGCYGDQLECRESELDLDGCDSEEEALSECMGNRSVGGPVGSVNACGQIKACCVAQSEQVEGADVSACDIYDEADEDACAAAIDVARGYEYPEGTEIPSECRF